MSVRLSWSFDGGEVTASLRWSRSLERLLRQADALDFRYPGKPKPPRRRRPGPDGGEPVPVEPDRPRRGEGGAAAALEFDQP